jgi:hypothetical protein
MPKFVVRYTETVVQEVVIDADNPSDAGIKFDNGEYSEPRIIDAYDAEFESIIMVSQDA